MQANRACLSALRAVVAMPAGDVQKIVFVVLPAGSTMESPTIARCAQVATLRNQMDMVLRAGSALMVCMMRQMPTIASCVLEVKSGDVQLHLHLAKPLQLGPPNALLVRVAAGIPIQKVDRRILVKSALARCCAMMGWQNSARIAPSASTMPLLTTMTATFARREEVKCS